MCYYVVDRQQHTGLKAWISFLCASQGGANMRLCGDLARGGHQARWVELFEVSVIRTPWYRRLGWRVKDFFLPRSPVEGPGRVRPGVSIRKIGTGYWGDHRAQR